MNSVEERPFYNTLWICEKWSDEAVAFAQRKLERLGITHIPAENKEIVTPTRKIIVPRMMPITEGISSAALREVVGKPEECAEIVGNLLLNEGIQRLEDLSMVTTGLVSNQTVTNYWSNTNSYLGVGDSNTAEAATQTELQAATNRFYKVMNATFPSRSSQTITFQSDFTTSEANYVWAEWAIAAGATTASGAGFTTGTINLNRKVAALGTKASGTWTLSGQITFS